MLQYLIVVPHSEGLSINSVSYCKIMQLKLTKISRSLSMRNSNTQKYVPRWHNWQVDVKLKIGNLYYAHAFSAQREQCRSNTQNIEPAQCSAPVRVPTSPWMIPLPLVSLKHLQALPSPEFVTQYKSQSSQVRGLVLISSEIFLCLKIF